MVRFYEIRDGLVARFGSETNVRKTLDISKHEWDTLGRLANGEPILQSRHRGRHVPNLRDATEEELSQARAAARLMMEKYCSTLDHKHR